MIGEIQNIAESKGYDGIHVMNVKGGIKLVELRGEKRSEIIKGK